SPGNVLAFTISPLTGAALSGASRHCVTSKSPLTGTIASSEAGGFWGPELKFAGFDGIIIKGKSPKPVYLWIKDGVCEIRNAEHIWGKVTGDAQDTIREELADSRTRVALIGPSGEKTVSFACITNELKHFNGRNGLGAVMGSKNLKAIAVRGTGKPEFADPDFIKGLAKQAAEVMARGDFFTDFKRSGTTLNVEWNTATGGLPTRNWTMGSFPEQDKLLGERYAADMMDGPGTCWACAQACKRDIKHGITDPVEIDPRYGGPEYETIGMCGSNLLIHDFNTIAAINQTASKYCVDTISLGGVIGFAMECFEKGIIDSKKLDGLELSFGNGKAAMALAEKIVKREGVGDLLAKGTRAAAAAFGPAAERIAVHVKGKEFPAHMAQTKGSLGLAYALNCFGPDHVSSEHDGAIASDPVGERLQGFGFYDTTDPTVINFEKAKLLAYSQRYVSGIDSVSTCNFIFNTWSMFGFGDLMDFIRAATGWEYTLFEFMLLGERRLNMMRAFNTREGFRAKDDDLPEKLFSDPLQDKGPAGGRKINRDDFNKAKEAYYVINGWDPATGIPGEYKLRELGLDWALGMVR
ncbi:MAG: aldehyde ferredoxin oxidoreductase, partial [Spirochaetales bacterium]